MPARAGAGRIRALKPLDRAFAPLLSCSHIVEPLGAFIYSVLAVAANGLPAPVTRLAARLCALAGWTFSPARRRAASGNLSRAGIEPARRAVFEVFLLQATNVIEMIASSRRSPASLLDRFEVEGREALDEALAGGRGAILVTAHVGSWETGALYLRAIGCRLHVVAGVQLNRLLTGAVRRAKERQGIEVVGPEDSWRRLLRALRANGVVALLVDGNVYTGGAEVVFFGAPVRMPEGPARLARAAGAPVVAGSCRRIGPARYRVRFERVLDAREAAALAEPEALRRIYAAVERIVRENADQWLLFRPLWGNGR